MTDFAVVKEAVFGLFCLLLNIMSDYIQLWVSDLEDDLDDLRKIFLHGGMTCPVPACGFHHYETVNSLWWLWKKTHREFVRCFRCPLCSFKHNIRSQLGHHLRQHHKKSGTVVGNKYLFPLLHPQNSTIVARRM